MVMTRQMKYKLECLDSLMAQAGRALSESNYIYDIEGNAIMNGDEIVCTIRFLGAFGAVEEYTRIRVFKSCEAFKKICEEIETWLNYEYPPFAKLDFEKEVKKSGRIFENKWEEAEYWLNSCGIGL